MFAWHVLYAFSKITQKEQKMYEKTGRASISICSNSNYIHQIRLLPIVFRPASMTGNSRIENRQIKILKRAMGFVTQIPQNKSNHFICLTHEVELLSETLQESGFSRILKQFYQPQCSIQKRKLFIRQGKKKLEAWYPFQELNK